MNEKIEKMLSIPHRNATRMQYVSTRHSLWKTTANHSESYEIPNPPYWLYHPSVRNRQTVTFPGPRPSRVVSTTINGVASLRRVSPKLARIDINRGVCERPCIVRRLRVTVYRAEFASDRVSCVSYRLREHHFDFEREYIVRYRYGRPNDLERNGPKTTKTTVSSNCSQIPLAAWCNHTRV